MEVLGHRKIETSYRYIRLYRQVYKNRQPKTFETKIAKQRKKLFGSGIMAGNSKIKKEIRDISGRLKAAKRWNKH